MANIWKKIKDGLKKAGEGLKKTFENAKNKINSFIKHPQNIIISAGLLPLKPYQPLMKKKAEKDRQTTW